MAVGVDFGSGHEEPVAVLGTTRWVEESRWSIDANARQRSKKKTDLSVDQRFIRPCAVVLSSEQGPKDGPPFEQETLSGVDWWLGVRRDICLVHKFSSGFCVPSLVAVVVDVDVEPVEEGIRRGLVDEFEGRRRRDVWRTETNIRSPSQESREELVSPSRGGPAGAGPVVIGVEDKK